MKLLTNGLSGYLLAERLSMTVFHSDPDAVSKAGLMEQRRALFGKPPEPGGFMLTLPLYWKNCIGGCPSLKISIIDVFSGICHGGEGCGTFRQPGCAYRAGRKRPRSLLL